MLLDVDHTPRHLLHPSHADFYTARACGRLAALLRPGGVFALWSDDPPTTTFGAVLAEVFTSVDAHVVTFANPYTGAESANTVYVANGRRRRVATGPGDRAGGPPSAATAPTVER